MWFSWRNEQYAIYIYIFTIICTQSCQFFFRSFAARFCFFCFVDWSLFFFYLLLVLFLLLSLQTDGSSHFNITKQRRVSMVAIYLLTNSKTHTHTLVLLLSKTSTHIKNNSYYHVATWSRNNETVLSNFKRIFFFFGKRISFLASNMCADHLHVMSGLCFHFFSSDIWCDCSLTWKTNT